MVGWNCRAIEFEIVTTTMAAKLRSAESGNRSSSLGVENAEFFKVFLPKLSSHQLRIPPDFTKHFRKTMKEKVILKNEDGNTWYVDVKETPDGVFLKDGWPSFVDHHGLKVGEFLVFRYVGSFSFLVRIFGINGCKKGTLESKSIATRPIRVKSEETSDSDRETETKPKQTSRKVVNRSSSADGRSKRLKRFREVNEAKEEVVDEDSDQSENYELDETSKRRRMVDSDGASPSFSIVLAESNINKGVLCVPAGFWRAHMEKQISRKEATLFVGNKAWNVGVVIYDGRKLLLRKGWFKFVKENSLKVGSLCTFQLIATKHLSFNVTFSR